MYSSRLLDHFQNPRNAGELERPDTSAQVQNPACGDVVRLTAKFSGGQIEEIAFKAKGCVAAMACASALTELVKGARIEDARKLKKEDVINAVGGLPEASVHASSLAIDALAAVLSNIKD
jgi:nitrogen fixation NifU-like protein